MNDETIHAGEDYLDRTTFADQRAESYRTIVRYLEEGDGVAPFPAVVTSVPGYRDLRVVIADGRAQVYFDGGGLYLGEIADGPTSYDLRDHNRRFLATVDQTFQRALSVLLLLTAPEVERIDPAPTAEPRSITRHFDSLR